MWLCSTRKDWWGPGLVYGELWEDGNGNRKEEKGRRDALKKGFASLCE